MSFFLQVPGNKHKHTFVSPGSKCRWPQKATRIVLDLVKNAESNAEVRTKKSVLRRPRPGELGERILIVGRFRPAGPRAVR